MADDGSESNVQYERGCVNMTCTDSETETCLTANGKKVGVLQTTIKSFVTIGCKQNI